MFRKLPHPPRPDVTISINGKAVRVAEGTSVWAAMALDGQDVTRLSPVSRKPRSAYCAMGVCFECLVEVDGMPNRQACLLEAAEGMKVLSQRITGWETPSGDDDV